MFYRKFSFRDIFEIWVYGVVILYPLLMYYENSFVIYMIYISMITFVFVKCKIYVDLFTVYIIWLVLISLVLGFGNTTAMNRLVGIVVFGAFTMSIKTAVSIEKFEKLYRFIAWGAVLFFILQIISFYIFKTGIMFRIPFLELKKNLDNAYMYLTIHRKNDILTRFPGAFSEPSHHASFVVPLLAMVLYDNLNKRKKIIEILLITLTLLVSSSALGIVMAFAVFFFWFVNQKAINKTTKAIWIAIAILFSAIVFLFLMKSYPSFAQQMQNLFVSKDEQTASKSDWRIYRGIQYYFNMPFLNKIIGVGFANSTAFSAEHGVYTSFDWIGEYTEFYAGFLQIFIYTGLIGAIILGSHFMRILKRKTCKQEMLLWICYILLLASSSVLFEGFACIYISLALNARKKNDSPKKYVITNNR